MTHSSAPLRVDSPCIKLCVLDEAKVCLGCGRHVDEIAGWTQMTPAERHAANVRSDARRTQRPVGEWK
jgi:predicted Fe-S protein YdhL (DUF1289 family)